MKAVTIALAVFALAGCAGMRTPPAPPLTATAALKNPQGQSVGTATFSQVTGAVRVVLEARGLPPGQKGVHVHAVGKCDPTEFTSAGEHFNPDGKQHGFQSPDGPHAGDLPNLTIAADGSGRLEATNPRVTLGDGTSSLFDADGSAIVIHAAADDFKTDPTGNSGARVACGVIVKNR